MLPGLRSALPSALAGGKSAPQFVAVFTGSSSVSFSGVQSGDFLVYEGINNVGALPSSLSGWTNITRTFVYGSDYGFLMAYKVAAGTETSTGVGNSASDAVVTIYRAAGGASLGATATLAESGALGSSTATFNGVTLQKTDKSSIVHTFLHGVSQTSLPGLTRRAAGGAGSLKVQPYDTNGGVASFSSFTQSMGTTGQWLTQSIEIKAT